MERILVTGAAGFIGYHLSKKLIENGNYVIGIDNMNSYYDVQLKKNRLNSIYKSSRFKTKYWTFKEIDIQNNLLLEKLFLESKPNIVINLAAQAGVRYSLENPKSYINSNIVGFQNIIECSKKYGIKNFIYASSSSVYGGNKKIPFSENDPIDHPCSLYAATKRSNELIAHVYSHLYNLPCTGLRFFTVYGPWGRPDMAPMLFTNAIFSNNPIKIFNHGKMSRDFTYIDDVIEAIIKIINKPAVSDIQFNKIKPNPSSSWAPHRIFNIGNSSRVLLMDFIEILENEIGRKVKKEFLNMQLGDVKDTLSDTSKLQTWINFEAKTSLKNGIKEFIKWYKEYFNK